MDTLLDTNNVVRGHLIGEDIAYLANEAVIDIRPLDGVFQIWVHSRKR